VTTSVQSKGSASHLSNHLDYLTICGKADSLPVMPTRCGSSSKLDFSAHLRADDVVTWPQGTGEPLGLTQRLVEQRHALPPLQLFIGMTTSKTLSPEHADRFRFRVLNGAGSTRKLTVGNVADIVPCYVSAVPALVRSGAIRVDALLLRVKPHPKPGYFTVGVMADFVPAFVAAARCVIAEIDHRLPVTAQDALVAESDIDVLTECDAGEVLMPDPEPDESLSAGGQSAGPCWPSHVRITPAGTRYPRPFLSQAIANGGCKGQAKAACPLPVPEKTEN